MMAVRLQTEDRPSPTDTSLRDESVSMIGGRSAETIRVV